MSDNIQGLGQTNNPEKGADHSKPSANAAAEKMFSEKMAQLHNAQDNKADALTQKNKQQQLGSLFEQMTSAKSQQEQFVEKHALRDQTEGAPDAVGSAGHAAADNISQDDTDNRETEILNQIVASVKIRVDRNDVAQAVTLDVSAYLPGTSFSITKQDGGFSLGFQTQSTQSADLIRQQKANLISRLQAEVDPQLSYKVSLNQG